MRWIFVIGAIAFSVIAVLIAIHLVDFIQKGEEVKRLNDLIIGKSQKPVVVSTNLDSERNSTSKQQIQSVPSQSTDSPNMDVDESMK
jgi:hypothetical protein